MGSLGLQDFRSFGLGSFASRTRPKDPFERDPLRDVQGIIPGFGGLFRVPHRLHSSSFLWLIFSDPIRLSQKGTTMEPLGIGALGLGKSWGVVHAWA